MHRADLDTQSSNIEWKPVFCECAQALRCRRPRPWWIRGVDVLQGGDLKVVDGDRVEKQHRDVKALNLAHCHRHRAPASGLFLFALAVRRQRRPMNHS